MPQPNFLIIGAAKSGTSSLWAWLRQHPQVFLPSNKEPNYFAFDGELPPLNGPTGPEVLFDKLHRYTIVEDDAYLELFAEAGDATAIGEASVRYLYFPTAAARIHAQLPHVRLIAVLRDPVRRLYSHYNMNVGEFDLEPLTLTDALEQEQARIEVGWAWDWHYTGIGRYAEQLRRYFELFGRHQILVLSFEELVRDTSAVLKRVFEFLEVDSDFAADTSRVQKAAYMPRSRILQRLANAVGSDGQAGFVRRAMTRGLRALNARRVPAMCPQLRKRLHEEFADEPEALRELTGEDFSHWFSNV